MASSSSEGTLELYFLISKFLENGPCQNTFKTLQQELEKLSLLPKTLSLDGGERCQTLPEMSKKHPNINEDTLLQICHRLRDVRRSQDPPGMLNVSSLLCSGRYSILRADASIPKPPYDRIVARRRGCPISSPAGSKNSKTNLVRLLDARSCSGGLKRRDLVWPKLYNRMQLLNQTVGHISGVYCVLFDQTGQFIFTGADDLLVKVWSTVSGRLLATLRGASSEITDLSVNLENTLLAAGSLDRVCYVWCLQTTSLIAQLSANVGILTAVKFCPKTCHGIRYLTSTSTDGSVAFWMYSHEPIGKDTQFIGQPIIFNEKMRPGVAQMICMSFSPGGMFLAAGSADHHVRVYLNTGGEGPQRIMEEEAHSDRVDSIQWANRGLRFVSGSKDGTALIWRYSHQKWNFIKLDNTLTLPGDTEQDVSEEQQRQKPRVSMVCWDKSDKWIVTAGQDAALKIWNSDTGELLKVLRNHRRDVFVLEPHPLDEGILLSAGHDGLLCIWDIRDGSCLLQHQNLIEGRGSGLIYDAKWSPDGNLIAVTDSNGHILLFGFGAATASLKQIPKQLFFNTDYWPLVRDETQGVLDATTGEPPHLMAAPYLVDVEGTPYSPDHQLLVPGREFQDTHSMEIPRVIANENPSRVVENGIGAAYFPSAELASSRGNTPNAWQTRMLLPLLQASVINQITNVVEAKAKAEEVEYNRERKRPLLPLKPVVDKKTKVRKKRNPTYKTRAAATGNASSEFVNPETLEMSHSSESSMDSSDDSNFSDSSSSSVYSDWIADHGVSLEPPTRSRRRRPPARLSPSPTNTRKRTKQTKPKDENPEPSSESDEEDPLKPEKVKEVPAEYIPPKWLSEVMPRKAPYYPQMGDHVIFFQEGYKIYLDVVLSKQVYKPSTRDAFSRLTLDDPIHVLVVGIKYEIKPPRLCCLRLAVMDEEGTMTNQIFSIKYHDVPDVIDFLVLKQTYDLAMSRKWEPGDRFRCVIDDSWWLGRIQGMRNDKVYENSPFLSLNTLWDNGETEFMSPWDLEPVDPTRIPTEPGGCIDLLPEEAQALLYTPGADEWPDGDRDAACGRLIAGLDVVMTLSVAEPFCAPVDLNLYPLYAMSVEYPLDVSTIKARLENRFYRRLTGVQFDVRYLATNAEKFNDSHSQIVKHARIVTELCLGIIKAVKDKREFDVMEMYRQQTDGYKSSSEGEDKVDGEIEADDDDGEGVQLRSSKSLALENVNWRGDCERLLRELNSLPDSVPFRQPVDLTELPDYLQVITTPMDLGTVREELMAGNYSSPKDFHEAVCLIFSNSRKYNTNKKSRIHGMAVRLSNLFEARMDKLDHEWKTSRRRRILQATQKRKLRMSPKPGPSRRAPSPDDNAVDPLRSSDNEDTLPLTENDDPQPSTSRQPIRIVVRRRWSPVGASRDTSDSDEDTNLSTLRSSLKQSAGDARLSAGGTDSLSKDAPFKNGAITESSTDMDDYRELSLLQRSEEPNDIGGNGHSYAKVDKAVSSNTKIKIIKIPKSASGDANKETSTETTSNGMDETPANGVQDGVETSPEPDNDASSLWNDEDDAEEEGNVDAADETEATETSESSNGDSSGSSFYKTPVRRKSRRTATKKLVQKKQKQATDSDESYEDELSSESNETSESEFSEPVRTRGSTRRNNGTTKRRKRRQRRESTSAEDSDEPPRNRRRRSDTSNSDDDASSHRKSKRRRKVSTASESSTWEPSDSDQKTRSRRSQRRKVADSDDEDEGCSDDETGVSSRGRLRKLTEKAKAVFRRKR